MVAVSPVPKMKSRTLSDVFGSAEVSSSGHRGVLRKGKHLRPFVDEKAPKSYRGKGSRASVRTRCPSSVLSATAGHNAYWSAA